MVWLFWLALIFVAYTLLGYPLLLWILSIWRSRPHQRAAICPTVSIIIAVHDEAVLLNRKIMNCLELTYPVDRREIIVASDGPQDATGEIVRSFAECGVKLVESHERRGKHYVQMLARDASCGEILIFTDVSVQLESDALQKIVSNFSDSSVGCVSSEDKVVDCQQGGLGEKLFVLYEMWLRRLESRVGSLVGISGSFSAARRELCADWHSDQSSDFFLALHAAERGLRAVVDPECCGHYWVVHSARAEFQRKIRTVMHGLDVLFAHAKLLHPLGYGLFSWQLITHKLFRWLLPLGFFSLFLASFFLRTEGGFYNLSFALQASLYGAGVLALSVKRLARFKAFKMAGFFLLGNVATVVAWFSFLGGERLVTWEPTRRG